MGKKKGNQSAITGELKEGKNLLGEPTFEQLENGRFKCAETGHEVPAHAKDAYSETKHCRIGIIDSAMASGKPPLNMFRQDPATRLKLICQLTGATVNKSEEHIWKHINGKHFLNALDKMESEKDAPNGTKEENEKKSGEGRLRKKMIKKKKKKKNADEITTEIRDSKCESTDSENETDFWMPPSGERWDHDDGGDRWGSDSESGLENDDTGKEDVEVELAKDEAKELSNRTKRMSVELGPSSHASRKKKKKTKAA